MRGKETVHFKFPGYSQEFRGNFDDVFLSVIKNSFYICIPNDLSCLNEYDEINVGFSCNNIEYVLNRLVYFVTKNKRVNYLTLRNFLLELQVA